ncbi:MAG: 2-hydroxyacid dehydrogenase [Deltaproteobacteria bacterium]|nr:2-hydroxyacid dehydrogenase [Deltaproteobacteria bacterium]
MKAKVMSILPRKRFEDSGVRFPGELEMHFRHAVTEEEVIEVCRGMDFLFLPASFPVITPRILENIPSIRMIQSAGVGYDRIDAESAALYGIPVCNAPGQNNKTVAEYTLALLVAFQRRMVICDREVKAGNYASIREKYFKEGLQEVRDTRMGIVGLGAIGREVARLVKLLGAKIFYYDVLRAPETVEADLGVTYMDLDELLSTCDVISLHVPLHPKTRHLIGKRELDRMPPGSILINTARGEIVDSKALAAALEEGRIGGAAVDTISPEPPPADHPLLNLSAEARDRLLITPHVAGITRGAFHRMLSAGLENIAGVTRGEPPRYVVNGVMEARKPSS